MTAKKNATTEIVKDVQAVWEPWINAAQVWQDEVNKMREVALDNMQRGLDDSHRLAKESLSMMHNFTNSVQKQVNTQMDRSRELLTNIISQ